MAKKSKDRVAKVAKAGRRASPKGKGGHITTPEDRARGRWLHNLGFDGFFPKPVPQGGAK